MAMDERDDDGYVVSGVWRDRLHDLISTTSPGLRERMVDMDDGEIAPSRYRSWSRANMILHLLDHYWQEEDGDWQGNEPSDS